MIRSQLVDSFPAHFFIEMYYNREKKNGGFIYEEKLDHLHFTQLCESYGVFNGCEEITKEIILPRKEDTRRWQPQASGPSKDD